MAVEWDRYDQFSSLIDKYMPSKGEGDTRASQLVTAVNKLIYKWYNDGDVYDNTGAMSGWANDLSSYANWIYKYFPKFRTLLDGIYECYDDNDYEELLWNLAVTAFNVELLERLNEKERIGSIYDCEGRFEFREDDEDEDEDYEPWSDEEEYYEDEDVESAVDINAAEGEEEVVEVEEETEELTEEEEFEQLMDFMKDDFDLIMGSLDKLQRSTSEDRAVGKTIAKTLYNSIQDALAAAGERF